MKRASRRCGDLRLPVRPEQLVGEADRHHPEQRALGIRHGAQRLVERARPEQEGAVQQRAVGPGAPLQDPGAVEVEESVHEHLGDGIEPLREGRIAADRAHLGLEARQQAEVLERAPPVGIVRGGAASSRARWRRRARRCRSAPCRRRGSAGWPRARSRARRSGSAGSAARRGRGSRARRRPRSRTSDAGTSASPNMNGMRSFACPTIATGVPARARAARNIGMRSAVTSGLVPRLARPPGRSAICCAITFAPSARTLRATCV